MKTNNYIFILLMISVVSFIVGCEDKETVPEPEIVTFEVSSQTINAGESVLFTYELNADMGVLWTGDDRHNYQESLEGHPDFLGLPTDSLTDDFKAANSGTALDLEVTEVEYTYSEQGEYEVVLIATNRDSYGENIKQKSRSLTVTVLEASGE